LAGVLNLKLEAILRFIFHPIFGPKPEIRFISKNRISFLEIRFRFSQIGFRLPKKSDENQKIGFRFAKEIR